LVSSVSWGQELNYYSFNELYNFDVNTIYDIKQDKSGDFWFGTNQGLIHFNGRDFTKYEVENYSKDASNIKFDDYGRIWFSNFGGQLFYLKNQQLHTVVSRSGNFIYNYIPFSENEVYYFTLSSNKLYKVNASTGKTEVVSEKTKGNRLLDIFKKNNAIELVLQSYNKALSQEGDEPVGEVYIRLYNPGEANSRPKEVIPKGHKTGKIISYNPAKRSTFLSQDSLYHVRINKTGIKFYNLDRANPLCFELKRQKIAANTVQLEKERLLVLHKTAITSISLAPPFRSKNLINNINASKYFLDKEGNTWVGTLDEGIFIIPNECLHQQQISESEITHSVYTEDKTLYFINTKGELIKSEYPYSNSTLINDGFTPSEEFKYDKTKKSIFFNNHNEVFDVPTQTLQKTKLYPYITDKHYLGANHFLVANGDASYLKTDSGIKLVKDEFSFNYRFNFKKSDAFTSWIIRNVRCDAIIETPDKKNLYIQYIDGVYHYSADEPKPLKFQGKPVLSTTIINDLKNGIWITTKDGYLLRYRGSVLVSSMKLPSLVTKIATYKNLLFLLSDKKIYRLNTNTSEYTILNEFDGLNYGKVNSLFCHKDSLFVVEGKNVQRIPCSYQFVNKLAPKIFIDEIQLFGKKISSEKEFFNYHENFITIYFHAMAIRSKGKNRFEYRINRNAKWISLPNNTEKVNLQNLAPGEYEFQIRTFNEDGVASAVATYPFVIDKHFAQKWWFILLVVMGVVSISLIVFRFRYNSLQRQNYLRSEQDRLKKEVYKSKIAAIRSQMNPHFMFNALNTIQEFIVTNQKEIASEYLADFADLMRKYLEQSKHEEILLSEEMETLEIYLSLENLRFEGDLNYSIYCEPKVNPYELKIPVMLFQPFVENAIKHGLLHKKGEKRLSIVFETVQNNRLRCTIEDNGIGREASAKLKGNNHISFSTGAIDHKTELVNKSSDRQISFEIIDLQENEKPSGTKVIIELDITNYNIQ